MDEKVLKIENFLTASQLNYSEFDLNSIVALGES